MELETMQPEQLGEMLGAEIQPRFKPESRVFAFNDEGAVGLEQLLLMATRLKHAREQYPIKRLIIASAIRGEGKTSVAVNLAHTLASHGSQKVLLVDADLRKPDLLSLYGVPETKTANYLNNGAKPTQLIRRVTGTNLYL